MRKPQFLVPLACALAAPVAAQNSLPGLENFTLERPAPTPTPSATVTPPAPTPTVTPPATPSPAPTASVTPRPSATPTTARPTPATTPTGQPTPRPTATPTDVTPAVAEPSAPSAQTTPAVTNTVAPDPTTESTTPEPTAWGLWAALAALVLVAVGGFLWWQQRDRGDDVDTYDIAPEAAAPITPLPPVAVQPEPAPVPAPEPVAPKPAKPAAPGGLVTSSLKGNGGLVTSVLAPELRITVTPFRAGADTLRASLEYEVRLDNIGRGTARDISVQTWMIGAGNHTAEDLITLFTSPAGIPMLDPFDLPASAAIDLAGVATVPREMLSTINAGDRRMFVPLLAVRASYRDGRGSPQSVNAAFLVGIERDGQARLAPLPLDRGARMYDRLAARPYGA